MPETAQSWLFTSSGAGVAINGFGLATMHTFYITATTGASSGAIAIQAATSSGGPFGVLFASTTVNTSGVAIQSYTGPLEWVRPFAASCAGTMEVRWLGSE